jgi:hypothetical protein
MKKTQFLRLLKGLALSTALSLYAASTLWAAGEIKPSHFSECGEFLQQIKDEQETKIKALIVKRTKNLRDPKNPNPKLIHEFDSSIEPLDVQAALDRMYQDSIFKNMTMLLHGHIDQTSRLWANSFRNSASKKKTDTAPLDHQGFPKTPLFQSQAKIHVIVQKKLVEKTIRQLAEELFADYSLEFQKLRAQNLERIAKLTDQIEKATAALNSQTEQEKEASFARIEELEQELQNAQQQDVQASYRVPNAKGSIEMQFTFAKALAEHIKNFYQYLLRHRGSELQKQSYVDLRSTEKISWEPLIEQLYLIKSDFFNTLQSNIPLSEADYLESLKSELDKSFDLEGIPTTFKDGHVSLNMPTLASTYYNTELATPIVAPETSTTPHEHAPTLLLIHGDGADQSNASSWKGIAGKMYQRGFNPVAISMPTSGPFPTSAMNLEGMYDTASYVEIAIQWAEKLYNGNPLTPLGRSSGSTKLFLHALLYQTRENPVPLYFITSFSNPYTLDEQIGKVREQLAKGDIKHIVEESLNNASVIAAENLEYFELMKKANPKAFEHFGDNITFPQGDRDEDATEEVVSQLYDFRYKYAPLAHVVVLENTLKDFDISKELHPEQQEGTHFLYAPDADPKAKHKDKFRGVDSEYWPQLASQFDQMLALKWGYYDYQIDLSPVKSPALTKIRERLKTLRENLCGFNEDGTAVTFIEWYRKRLKISDKEFETAEVGQRYPNDPKRRLAARLKIVQNYWVSEQVRIDEYLKEHPQD